VLGWRQIDACVVEILSSSFRILLNETGFLVQGAVGRVVVGSGFLFEFAPGTGGDDAGRNLRLRLRAVVHLSQS